MKKPILHFLFLAFALVAFAQTPGKLTVKTTTSSTDPADPTGLTSEFCAFAPGNVMAIWIEDKDGKFVRSLAVWGKDKRYDLINWWNASGNDVSGFKVDASVKPVPVDGYTGATLKAYPKITCTWDGKDKNGVLVPDGEYHVLYELTDNETSIPLKGSADTTVLGNGIKSDWSVTFVKGAAPVSLTPVDVTSFGANSIVWTPSATAVDNVELDKLYSVYPNPAKSSISVIGEDIKSVEILDNSGNSVLKSNLQKIDISKLVNGQYVVKITTSTNCIVKKIIKK